MAAKLPYEASLRDDLLAERHLYHLGRRQQLAPMLPVDLFVLEVSATHLLRSRSPIVGTLDLRAEVAGFVLCLVAGCRSLRCKVEDQLRFGHGLQKKLNRGCARGLCLNAVRIHVVELF
jgi:hypothetical protein